MIIRSYRHNFSQVKEEQGTLNIRCNICEMTVFGIRLEILHLYIQIIIRMFRNLAAHISGRKHSGKISNKEWILVETQDNNAEEEQEESLQLPEPVAAVEVVLLKSLPDIFVPEHTLSLHRWRLPQD